jgi:hypothetical protein
VNKLVHTFAILLFCLTSITAQELSFGFKAGLNFSHFDTDDIEQAAEMDLESFQQNSGFHLGVVVSNKITDAFGVRGEFLFSQKGGRYEFEGDSYMRLLSFTGEDRLIRQGFRSMNLNISNAYIDIPLMVYVKPIKWLELTAGANVGVLISSTGAGELIFREQGQVEGDEFRGISLDYRFFSDEVGEFIEGDRELRMINGTSFEIPKNLQAYFEYPAGAETGLFNRLDFGLHAAANVFINRSLFVGLRFNYGLSDVTNEEVDRALGEINGSDFILRDDFDRNISLQASIGFSF